MQPVTVPSSTPIANAGTIVKSVKERKHDLSNTNAIDEEKKRTVREEERASRILAEIKLTAEVQITVSSVTLLFSDVYACCF